MKLSWLFLMMSSVCSASYINESMLAATSLATSALTIFPNIKLANEYKQKALLPDIDPQLVRCIRIWLEQQGYDQTTIANISFKLEAQDSDPLYVNKNFLCFSGKYYQQLQKLYKKKDHLTEKEKVLWEFFFFMLHHEMFHIIDKHTKKAVLTMASVIILLECIIVAICTSLLDKNSIIFALCIVSIQLLKICCYLCAKITYQRKQEYDAETWAINKADKQHLEIALCYYEGQMWGYILEKMLDKLQAGRSADGIVDWVVDNYADDQIRTIDVERFVTDDSYAQEQMPAIKQFYKRIEEARWPLILLSLIKDLNHPTLIDNINQIQERIKLLNNQVGAIL